jgi:hypothetical protein
VTPTTGTDGGRSTAPVLDGSLPQWSSLSGDFSTSALLCGNGLSINVWSRFAYRSLFDQAGGASLAEDDGRLFSETENFERVLSDLGTAIRVNQVLGVDGSSVLERYQSVQRALGHAIREVHIRRMQVPDEVLSTIRVELTRYDWIFSTSYDLLVYWSMGCGGTFKPFVDLFRGRGKLKFDPTATDVFANQIPVYFPHGALHLVVGGSGETWKLRGEAMKTLLDQFGEPIEGDTEARPLLVTEGTARDKLRAIESNAYLAHSLARLRSMDLPIVVFGASLDEQDSHLLDALNEHPERPIAISMVKDAASAIRTRQREIYARLHTDRLRFFDAESHPLGAPGLRVG